MFIYLPRSTVPVVCGRFQQVETVGGQRVGRYTYGQSYTANPGRVALDPIGLPVRRGTFPPVVTLGGVYGALRDAGPDAWGRVVIERARGTREALPEIEYLLAAGDDRTGALAFGRQKDAPAASRGHQKMVALPELLEAAELVEGEAPLTPEVQRAAELLLHGLTMGGTRPKALVEDDGAQWIAKFPAKTDRWNVAAVEAGLLTLAERCGMHVPAVRTERVAGKPVMLVQRFDRQRTDAGYLRSRYLSALTLLNADEIWSLDWSYLKLVDEVRRRSAAPDEDRRELYRRMVFNALVSNSDDHPRNHAMISWAEEDWRLSPLFDVVPSGHAGSLERDLALIAGHHGRSARRANLVSAASEFRVTPDEAHGLIDQMKALLSAEWQAAFRRFGASAGDLEALAHAIVPAGFEDAVPPPSA